MKLAVITCTMNLPAFARSETPARFAAFRRAHPAHEVLPMFVINQGERPAEISASPADAAKVAWAARPCVCDAPDADAPEYPSPAIRATASPLSTPASAARNMGEPPVPLPAADFTLIHQGNFGGTGGFTRGILEAKAAGATHFILMDDDAVPAADAFQIIFDFYATRPPAAPLTALVGTIFSAQDPARILSSGSTIRPADFSVKDRLRDHIIRPAAAAAPAAALTPAPDVDYGAWCLFACPVAAVDKVGLPLPIFIHGDDIEFGIRLKHAGIPTLPLAGLHATHPDYGVPLKQWYLYFMRRNRLIEKAVHFPRIPTWRIAAELFQKAFYQLLAYQYDSTAYLLHGLNAYLDGPAPLRRHPATALAFAQSLAARYPIKFETAPAAAATTAVVTPPAPRGMGGSPMFRAADALSVTGEATLANAESASRRTGEPPVPLFPPAAAAPRGMGGSPMFRAADALSATGETTLANEESASSRTGEPPVPLFPPAAAAATTPALQTSRRPPAWRENLRILALNGLLFPPRRRAAAAPPPVFEQRDFHWSSVFRLRRYALGSAASPGTIKTYELRRLVLLRLALQTLAAILRFLCQNRRVRLAWQRAFPALTSEPFWREYLSQPPPQPPPAARP